MRKKASELSKTEVSVYLKAMRVTLEETAKLVDDLGIHQRKMNELTACGTHLGVVVAKQALLSDIACLQREMQILESYL